MNGQRRSDRPESQFVAALPVTSHGRFDRPLDPWGNQALP